MRRILVVLCVLCAVIGVSSQEKVKRFAGGMELGGDFGSRSFGLHIGGTFRYGHYTDLFNFTAGVNFNLNQTYHGQEEVLEYFTRASTIGGQIVIPVVAKFNVLKCTDVTRFYAGTGAEAGFRLYAKDLYTGLESEGTTPVMNKFTVAGLVQVGVMGKNFDAGIYYKHYINELVNDKFPEYQQNARFGINLAYYF